MSQYILALPHTPAYAASQFVISDCNRKAYAWCQAWPEWPACGLIIYGPAQCGKTHLSMVWQEKAAAVRLEKQQLGTAPSAELLKGAKRCVLEDIDTGVDEPALFHLLNHLSADGGNILLTATIVAKQWNVGLPDLRSRLLALPSCAIEPPDDAVLQAVLRKQFADRQILVADDVMHYLTARMERSFAAAGALVEALDKAALAEKRAITLKLAKSVLEQEPGLF